ncbi:RWD domain-containing protein 2B [Podochytrium sp. JEL0797]|nr:RWD domain-containing protein 2B [Podochytrium sp. JEL0797]
MDALATFDLLQCMFPEELTVLHPPNLAELYPLTDSKVADLSEISLAILIKPTADPHQQNPPSCHLTVCLPMTASDICAPEMSVKYEPWMSRELHAQIQSQLPADVLEAVEFIRDQIPTLESLESDQIPIVQPSVSSEERPLKRFWFLLISLSTKSKRDDLVNWAPEYGLTGFVMAGKPAVVCLEGYDSEIDRFMAEIKSVSWADIPSFQKKISLVLTEVVQERAFRDMKEITHLFNMGGHRGNRPDLSQVRAWMVEKGVGHVFGDVFGGANSAFSQG